MSATAQPVASFLVPAGKNARYLRECLFAILSQSFIDWEVLVLDTGEGSETTLLAQAAAREDARIRHLVLPKGNSAPDSLNHGIQQARGDLLWILAPSARLATSQTLKDCITQFILNPRLGLAFCRTQAMDEDSIPYERYIPSKKNSDMPYHPTLYPGRLFFRQLLKGNLMPESSVIARKSCFERAGGLQPQLQSAAIWQHWLRICMDWDVHYDPLPKVLFRRERHAPEAASRNSGEVLEDELRSYLALEDYLKAHAYPKAYQHQAQFARLQFMRRKGFKLSFPDRLIRLYRSLSAAGRQLNPLKE